MAKPTKISTRFVTSKCPARVVVDSHNRGSEKVARHCLAGAKLCEKIPQDGPKDLLYVGL